MCGALLNWRILVLNYNGHTDIKEIHSICTHTAIAMAFGTDIYSYKAAVTIQLKYKFS